MKAKSPPGKHRMFDVLPDKLFGVSREVLPDSARGAHARWTFGPLDVRVYPPSVQSSIPAGSWYVQYELQQVTRSVTIAGAAELEPAVLNCLDVARIQLESSVAVANSELSWFNASYSKPRRPRSGKR